MNIYTRKVYTEKYNKQSLMFWLKHLRFDNTYINSKAVVNICFEKYNEAEIINLENDRIDLQINHTNGSYEQQTFHLDNEKYSHLIAFRDFLKLLDKGEI